MGPNSNGRQKSLVVQFSLGIAFLVFAVCVVLTITALFFFNSVQKRQITKTMTKTGKDAGKIVDLQMELLQKQVETISRRKEIKISDSKDAIDILIHI